MKKLNFEEFFDLKDLEQTIPQQKPKQYILDEHRIILTYHPRWNNIVDKKEYKDMLDIFNNKIYELKIKYNLIFYPNDGWMRLMEGKNSTKNWIHDLNNEIIKIIRKDLFKVIVYIIASTQKNKGKGDKNYYLMENFLKFLCHINSEEFCLPIIDFIDSVYFQYKMKSSVSDIKSYYTLHKGKVEVDQWDKYLIWDKKFVKEMKNFFEDNPNLKTSKGFKDLYNLKVGRILKLKALTGLFK